MEVKLSRGYNEEELNEVPSLRVSKIVGDSVTDGPELRVAVFAQGGFRASQSQASEGGALYRANELLDIITNQHPVCRAVTFTGDEPFDQALGFGWLAVELSKLGYSIATYTGYTFEELCAECLADNEAVARFLCMCNVLIDGPRDEAQYDPDLKFRYSRNQRILDVDKCFDRGDGRVIPFIKVDEGWN